MGKGNTDDKIVVFVVVMLMELQGYDTWTDKMEGVIVNMRLGLTADRLIKLEWLLV